MKIIEKIENGLKNKIGILGAGAWGIALSIHFANLGYQVFLWCYEEEIYNEILTQTGSGPFLSGMVLSKKIIPLKNIKDLFENTMVIFSTAPMAYLRETLISAKPFFNKSEHFIISTARGAEDETYLLPNDILHEVFGETEVDLFFYGFDSAKDLAMNNFSSGILASNILSVATFLQKKMFTSSFALNVSNDLSGSIVCSSFVSFFPMILKNLQKAGKGENFKTYFLGQCFKEIIDVVKITGGKTESILQVLGPLYSTINKSFYDEKKIFDSKYKIENISTNYAIAIIPEDMAALLSMINLAQFLGASLPICQQIKTQWLSGENEIFEFQI